MDECFYFTLVGMPNFYINELTLMKLLVLVFTVSMGVDHPSVQPPIHYLYVLFVRVVENLESIAGLQLIATNRMFSS